MSEYDKKPANTSHTWDNEEEPQASRQAPINEILQAYMNPVIQCLIIPANEVGLEEDINTDDMDDAISKITQLMNENRIPQIRFIQRQLKENGNKSGWFGTETNDEQLLVFINNLLESAARDKKPMAGQEKNEALKQVANLPEVDKNYSEGINIWVLGDQKKGIGWGIIGDHLRGLLDDSAYEASGRICATNEGKKIQDFSTEELIQMGKNTVDQASETLNDSLDNFPDFKGKSYRQANVANQEVYTSNIKVGDVIKDKAFWSTSLFRGAGGGAGSWTDRGKPEKPIAYFIIEGKTGKYIAKYAKIEGEREILFKKEVMFRVTRIVNENDCTFFVYLTEVDSLEIEGAEIKNPYNGQVYPSGESSSGDNEDDLIEEEDK